MKFRKYLLLLLVFTAVSLSAVNDNAGTTGFNFMKINFSTRSVAMGTASTAVADEADAAYINSAGLLNLKRAQATTSFVSYLGDYQGGTVCYARKLNEHSSWGAYLQYLTVDGIKKTLSDNEGNYVGEDGDFGSSDLLAGFSYGQYINSQVNLGVSIKFLHESIDNQTASAVAADFSLLHQTVNPKLKVGITLKNIGKQLTYFTSEKYEENLPVTGVVGFQYKVTEKFIGALDLYKPFDNDFAGKMGLEYKLTGNLALRAGYRSNASEYKAGSNQDALSGLSFGTGILYNRYKIDYAVSSYGTLGLINQISLSYMF